MSNDKFSIINIDGASDVAIKLLDMIEHAVGWTVIPKGSKRDFEDGLEIYKKSIMEDENLTGIEKGAKISEAKKNLKQYINQGKIISYAINEIRDDAKMIIDDDWLSYFFEYAKNFSNDDVQKIWGKILAEEVNGDSSVKRKLINCLSLIDYKCAKEFGKLCSMTVNFYKDISQGISPANGIVNIPLILRGDFLAEHFLLTRFSERTRKVGLEYAEVFSNEIDLEILKEIGLIDIADEEDGFFYYSCRDMVLFEYNGCSYRSNLIENLHNSSPLPYTKLQFGWIKFTAVGEELYNILKVEKFSKLELIICEYFKTQGRSLEKHNIDNHVWIKCEGSELI